ncbi:MAG TPA: hypothetical protein V6D08_18240 [Candidatus Obscuribacterales bacterium]
MSDRAALRKEAGELRFDGGHGGDGVGQALSREAMDLSIAKLQRNPDRRSSANEAKGGTPACILPQLELPSEKNGKIAAGKDANLAQQRQISRVFKYSDGTTITDYTNGDSVKVTPEGNKVTTRRDGTMISQDKDGRVSMIVERDGTTTMFDHKKGTKTTERPDGKVIIEGKDGTRTTIDRKSLKTVVERPKAADRR